MSKQRTLARGRFLALVDLDGWEYCTRVTGDAVVAIVAVTAERELILTEQYRPPVGADVIELPAGLVGDEAGAEDESKESAARRELEEETGYRAGELVHLGRGPSSAGLASEIIDFYAARELEQVTEGGGTESESIRVLRVPLSRVDRWFAEQARAGRLIDPKVYAGLWFVQRELA